MNPRTLLTVQACLLLNLVVNLPADDESLEKKNRLQLDNVVVVATRHERPLAEVPYQAWVWNAEDTQLHLQARTVSESLQQIPGIMLQKTGHGMTSPYLRGLTSQRTALYADGIRLNNSFLREGPNQYWNLVDHFYYVDTEVLLGPASVLYGSDAVGGVVHVRSGNLERGLDEGGLQWLGGRLMMRASSAEHSLSEHLRAALAYADDWTFDLGLSRQDFGELRSGDGERNPHTNYEQWGANLRARRWLSKRSSILFGYDRFEQDGVNRVHQTTAHVDYRGTSTRGTTADWRRVFDHQREMAFSRYEWRDPRADLAEFDFGVSYQNLTETYWRQRVNGREHDRFTRVETWSASSRAMLNTTLGTLNLGFDYAYDKVNSSGRDKAADGTITQRPQGVVADDASYALSGVYAQLESPLSERVEVISGIRYTDATMRAGTVNFGGGDVRSLKGNWNAVTASLRGLYKVLDYNALNLFAGASQGFRAPNLSDATREDDFGGGTEEPTADLAAERFISYEVGAKGNGDWGYFSTAYFYTQMENRIARLSRPEATKRNLDGGHIQGAEAMFLLALPENFELVNAVAWQYGTERTYYDRDLTQPVVDRPMSRIAPLSGTLALRWNHPAVWMEVSMDWAGKQDRYSDADAADNRFPPGGTPSWQSYNLRTRWRANEDLDLSLALENISDRKYRVHGSGVNEPGRNLIATAAWKF